MPGIMQPSDMDVGDSAFFHSVNMATGPSSSSSPLRARSSSCASGGTSVSGRQSLLGAMNHFVAAVDEMDGAVMIPCKLQDMHLSEEEANMTSLMAMPLSTGALPPLPWSTPSSCSGSVSPASSNGRASPVPATTASHVNATHSHLDSNQNKVATAPCTTTNGAATSTNGLSTPPNGQKSPSELNLYTYYGMLRAIKAELVRGPSPDGQPADEMDEDDQEGGDDVARQTAAMFRHHLKGLFDVLRHMTTTADVLTARYQSEIGDNNLSSTRSMAQYTLSSL